MRCLVEGVTLAERGLGVPGGDASAMSVETHGSEKNHHIALVMARGHLPFSMHHEAAYSIGHSAFLRDSHRDTPGDGGAACKASAQSSCKAGAESSRKTSTQTAAPSASEAGGAGGDPEKI